MEYVVHGHDGSDEGALERRMRAREAHLAHTEAHRAQVLMAAATLNDAGQMNGSVMVVDFPTREALDTWLNQEPYVLQNVWQKIEITPCKVGPAFKPTKA